jgi:menaquinone-9 beta-reductase
MDEYDVVVVGGSLAGCSAATLLARRGLRVALVEKDPKLDAYKTICGHFIQASAVPAMERLGILPAMQSAGAVSSQAVAWTPYGWVKPPASSRIAWSLRRSVLDPIVRSHAIETQGVEYLAGLTAVGVGGDIRIDSVVVSGRDGSQKVLKARLVVAADGRGSKMAQLARVPARVRENRRFAYFTYFQDVQYPEPGRALFWWTDPGMAALVPNEDGVSIAMTFTHKREIAEFRGNPEPAFRAHFRGLQDAPDLDGLPRVEKWLGKTDMPNTIRSAAARGMAFVGDAAQASDPIYGVGCGWAFQSADWLDQEVGPALNGSDVALDRALTYYARRHLRELGAHHFFISDYSSGRHFTPLERLIYSTGAHDAEMATRLEDFATRSVDGLTGVRRMVTRAAAVKVGMALGQGQ